MLDLGWYKGYTEHKRFYPKSHGFTYSEYLYLTAVAPGKDLIKIDLFNSIYLQSFISSYIEDQKLCLYSRITEYLQDSLNINLRVLDSKIFLLTRPQQLGVSFNPISFIIIYINNKVSIVLCEVSNTPWGDKHIYSIVLSDDDRSNGYVTKEFKKSMHVSPFNHMDQLYQITLHFKSKKFACYIKIFDIKDLKKLIFSANLNLSFSFKLMKHKVNFCTILYPFRVLKRIYIQAAILFVRRFPIYKKTKNININEKT